MRFTYILYAYMFSTYVNSYVKIIVVGNKWDMKKSDQPEGKTFAELKNLHYMETSAKGGSGEIFMKMFSVRTLLTLLWRFMCIK